MNIAAIMPCRGRAEQTVANVKRLVATAGMEHGREWTLTCVVDGDPDLFFALLDALHGSVEVITSVKFSDRPSREKVGYWRSLQAATTWAVRGCTHLRTNEPCVTHLVNLANDLLPGMHWLRRAADAYGQTFGDGPGLLGFNGDSHEVGHACHFLIDRRLLDRYGGWPVWYDHNFGDTELCQRAIADNVYAKAPWALLYHDHPYFGGADDQVYAEGRAAADRDDRLFHERRRAGWPTILPS